jgi:hydrophobic/amphiphilic exporter-1 (mainly G- bacteria), HAE1 family
MGQDVPDGNPRPVAAARDAPGGSLGPVVAIALVLVAVFVPTAFLPGITGRIYQQFAVTIAVSVILSAFNARAIRWRGRSGAGA